MITELGKQISGNLSDFLPTTLYYQAIKTLDEDLFQKLYITLNYELWIILIRNGKNFKIKL